MRFTSVFDKAPVKRGLSSTAATRISEHDAFLRSLGRELNACADPLPVVPDSWHQHVSRHEVYANLALLAVFVPCLQICWVWLVRRHRWRGLVSSVGLENARLEPSTLCGES